MSDVTVMSDSTMSDLRLSDSEHDSTILTDSEGKFRI